MAKYQARPGSNFLSRKAVWMAHMNVLYNLHTLRFDFSKSSQQLILACDELVFLDVTQLQRVLRSKIAS